MEKSSHKLGIWRYLDGANESRMHYANLFARSGKIKQLDWLATNGDDIKTSLVPRRFSVKKDYERIQTNIYIDQLSPSTLARSHPIYIYLSGFFHQKYESHSDFLPSLQMVETNLPYFLACPLYSF
jgi:hypothetical protein